VRVAEVPKAEVKKNVDVTDSQVVDAETKRLSDNYLLFMNL
jgi:hypothetical protein